MLLELLLCPVIKVSGKPHSSTGRNTNGLDPLGMKVWVTSQGKQPQSSEVLSKDKRNMGWVLEEGSYKYQL